jgi:agmatinase
MTFNPNSAVQPGSGIFGLPHSAKEAALHILPVAWEATTSYGSGAAKGPAAILQASYQVDLSDHEVLRPYEAGYFLLPDSPKVRAWNKEAKLAAQKIIAVGGEIGKNKSLQKNLARVNSLSEKLNEFVYSESKKILKEKKILSLLGGDHSTPYGAIKAASEEYKNLGILHFDAHSDTRDAYEGFTHSHASIMRNVLDTIPGIQKLVQVGIRDYCDEELEYTKAQKSRMDVFFDLDLAKRKFKGENFSSIASSIVSALPQNVWISFDIDGLMPHFCPHTGTPVPGGLDYLEAVYLIGEVVRSGRNLVGFDLNEVAPGPKGDEWDANVGARLLYKLAAWTIASKKLASLR